MTQELSKNLKCILLKNKIEIWLEEDRINNLKRILSEAKDTKFIEIDGQLVNIFEISGIYDANKMQEYTRRKNGEWLCKKGTWHEKGQQCGCRETLFKQL